jgi:hypothetical protein
MSWCAPPEQQLWIVQPLVEAGLAMDEIRACLFQLAFDDIVSEGRATAAGIDGIVRDQPARVRAAWAEMVGRMLALSGPDA